MDSNNLNHEVEFVDKTRFEIEYKDLSIINGKSIKKVETVSESTESSGVSIYKIFREDDVVLGTLYIRNGIKGIQGPQGPQGEQGLQGPQGPQGPAVPLVQTTGQSTTEAMSQKAVSDEFNQLKSDIADIANRMDYIGLSVVDGKLCITYLKEI